MFSTKIRGRRALPVLAAAGIAGLALAACTTSGDDGTSGDDEATTSVNVAVTNALTSLNSGTPDSNLNTNGIAEYIMGTGGGGGALGGSYNLDSEFNIVPDPTNLTYELTSEDPLTVQYSINEGAKWSDGEPITTTDLLLGWAISSGYYDDAVVDEESGEVLEGAQYFSIAGSTTGLDTTAFPEIDAEAGTLTITYGEPFVDWELVNLLVKPAHIFAADIGISLEEFDTLLKDQPEGDPENPQEPNAQLQQAGAFWLTGFNLTDGMPENEGALVGAGPYILSDFTPADGGSAVFDLNPNWAGKAPAYEQVILKFVGDINSQVMALRNGEVDVIYPTSVSRDAVTALEQAGAEIVQGSNLSYDHLDLSFSSEVFSNPTYREAFLLTVPRQAILESIITPIDPEAEVLDSQLFVASQPQYESATAENGYGDFTEPDIERAKELLAGATPEIRILYNSDNPDRVDTFQLVKQSAEEAGFVVVDAGSPTWSSELGSGNYDASIFGWVSSGAGYASLPQIFKSDGGGNYNGYSNADVDELVNESQTIIDDPERINQIQIQIDALTRQDFYGLPLFQTPGLTASMGTVSGLDPLFGGQSGVFYNILDWEPIG